MKKLSALLFASLLSVSGLASAEDVKQTYQGKTLNVGSQLVINFFNK